jgi:2'-5' RNA ligase
VRLFVAVELTPPVVAALAACSEALQRRSTRASRARITWVAADHLHVTVRFIGHVDEARAEAVAGVLRPDVTLTPFELAIEGIGTFPARGAPRVVWAGIARGIEPLGALEAQVSARLERCDVPREARPYHPHVTLARIRESHGLRPAAWLEGLTTRRFGISPVNAITLFESRPSPQGHVYIPVQRTPLNPAGPPSAEPALRM